MIEDISVVVLEELREEREVMKLDVFVRVRLCRLWEVFLGFLMGNDI